MNDYFQNKSENSVDYHANYQMTLQDYIILLKIHYKKILFFTFLGLGYGIINKFNSIPVYKSTATVVLKESPASSLIMDFSGNKQQNKITNEIQLIKSRALAKEVVKSLWNSNRRNNLHVFGTRSFFPKGYRIRTLFKEIISFGLYNSEKINKKSFEEPYTDLIGEKFVNNILKGISVKNLRSTNILNISFNSINADESSRIANLVAKTYVRLDSERSKFNAVNLVQFIDSLVLVKQNEIEDFDNKIRDFKLKNKMYSSDGDVIGITSQLNSYETKIYETKSEINIRNEKVVFLKSKLNDQEKYLIANLNENLDNQLIALRLEISRLESQIIQNKQIYGESHAAVKELKLKLQNFKKELDIKVEKLVERGITSKDPIESRQELITEIINLDAEIVGFEFQLLEYEKMLILFNEKLTMLPKKQMELSAMIRDSEILTENYSFLKKRYEEAKLNVAIKTGDSVLLDLAKRSNKPIGADPNRKLVLYIVIGFSIGLLFIFLIEVLDNSLKNIDEIEKYNLSILGIIPSIGKEGSRKNKRSFLKSFFKIKDNIKMDVERKLMTREDPRSPISEAYRGLRTNMLYSTDKKIKSILVSSAGPGEGKTTTVANLAITYANLGMKTVLIDTDLRRPVIDKVFNVERDPGVTNYIASQVVDYKKLLKKTEIENLSIITSGVIPPNPSEILGSEKMLEFVKLLENNFDIVLFDSPPLVAVTDANMISREIDQILLVVKAGHTDKKAFYHTVTNLRNINAPLIGVVMNAVTNKTSYGSYYYYYHQYNNYYGNTEDKG